MEKFLKNRMVYWAKLAWWEQKLLQLGLSSGFLGIVVFIVYLPVVSLYLLLVAGAITCITGFIMGIMFLTGAVDKDIDRDFKNRLK